MIHIELFSKDFIFGDFRTSDHGFVPASFSFNGMSEDELGMRISTSEEFKGSSPVPVYLGDKYNEKLSLQVTLVKDPRVFQNRMYFTEKECRWLLRELTGRKGYQWMKVIMHDSDEDIWYKAKVSNLSYERIGSRVAGIVTDFECDSFFAWTSEKVITNQVKADQPFYIFCDSDDLTGYLYPLVLISPSSPGALAQANKTCSQTTELKNMRANERITLDSQREIISSSLSHESLLNDFNLCWPKLVPGKNEFVCNIDLVITMKYRSPRKVGMVD